MWIRTIAILLLASVTSISFLSCQGDDDDAPANGEINETMFHNKIWSGIMEVPYHDLDETFSLSFNNDGTLEW